MQSVLSRIWTCVAESISYDDNHNTTAFLLVNKITVESRCDDVDFLLCRYWLANIISQTPVGIGFFIGTSNLHSTQHEPETGMNIFG